MKQMMSLKKLPELRAKGRQSVAKLRNYELGLRAMQEGKDIKFGGEQVTSFSREEAEEMAVQRHTELFQSLSDLNEQRQELESTAARENREERRVAKAELKELRTLLPKMADYEPTPANQLAYEMRQARSEVVLRPEDKVKTDAELKALETLATPDQIQTLLERQNGLGRESVVRIHNQELADIAELMQGGNKRVAQEAFKHFLEKDDSYFYEMASLRGSVVFAEFDRDDAETDVQIAEEMLASDHESLAIILDREANNESWDDDPETIAYLEAQIPEREHELTEAQAKLAKASAQYEQAMLAFDTKRTTDSALAMAGVKVRPVIATQVADEDEL
jgi:hypothetical protein